MDQRLPDDLLVRRFKGGGRPRIICLCGSTRFYEAFQVANYELTMDGAMVLSVGFYPHSQTDAGHGEGVGHDSDEKVSLDELHKRKIDLCDEVLVLNVGGYVGSSTLSEIDYALDIAGKSVKFLDKGQEWGTVLPGTIVPGSGTVVSVERSTPDSPMCYVTFDREGHPGAIPPGAPAWKEGCNVWSDGRKSSDSVPVGMGKRGNGFLYARASIAPVAQRIRQSLEATP